MASYERRRQIFLATSSTLVFLISMASDDGGASNMSDRPICPTGPALLGRLPVPCRRVIENKHLPRSEHDFNSFRVNAQARRAGSVRRCNVDEEMKCLFSINPLPRMCLLGAPKQPLSAFGVRPSQTLPAASQDAINGNQERNEGSKVRWMTRRAISRSAYVTS